MILTNVSTCHEVAIIVADTNHYRYSNSNGIFTFIEESKGRDTAMLNRWFSEYKKETNDTILYRLFSKNPLAFWRYVDYFNDPKYKLPFKDWNEILMKRGEIKSLDRWQNF